MPKIIFTSRYLRDAPPEQLGNYVKYIGTREGVEKIDESKGHLPATAAQKKLIVQLLRDLPKARAMLEYEDYRLHPTRRNASEFISTALEWKMDLLSKRAMFCKQMKIDSENLRWYAAFHNESYHPHVHVMV